MASVFARVGAKVQVVEYFDSIIASMDADLGKELKKSLEKLGIEFFLGHKVQEVTKKGKTVTVKAESKDGKAVELKGDYCLVSVGRKAYTDGLGLENIGIKTDARGKVPVNEKLETTVKGVYAIGDVIDGAMLAHKAEDEGCFVAEVIAGQHPHINYLLIPGVVYTWPEVAGVGYTEQQLKEKNIPYKAGKFPFLASGRARASMDIEGFIKVLAHKDTDEILGVHMIGPRIADLIAEAVVAMEFRASAEDITRMSHAHPTYTEAFKEACFAAWQGKAVHM
jgi:dihydrolipoamide dehydrogenase